MKKQLALGAGLIALCTAVPSEAWVTINVWQTVAGDVVAQGNGFLNLSALTNTGTGTLTPGMMPSGSIFLSGAGGLYNVYSPIPGAPILGPGTMTNASSGVGSILGGYGANIIVPNGYISGGLLTTGATWLATDLPTLGLLPGSYVWSWGSGSSADFIQLNVGAPAPEPETYALFAFGLGAAEWLRRRKRKVLKPDA